MIEPLHTDEIPPQPENDTFDFEETYVWSLTSSTNPYTGPSILPLQGVRFATENHICHTEISTKTTQQPLLHSRSIHNLIKKEDQDKVNCVGYHATSSWEVLALLDPSKLSNETRRGGDESDHRRSASLLEAPMVDVNSDAAAPVESTLPETKPEDTTAPGTGMTSQLAHIVLRSLSANSEESYSTAIDFRPLAITIAETLPLCVWLGSADHAQLYAYRPEQRQAESLLISVPLSDAAFVVSSPVMAIQCCPSDLPTSGLVLACQDGTIRLLTWDAEQNDTFGFSGLQLKQVIIDGPILALHVQWSSTNETHKVTAGSLCGYVAVWQCDSLAPPTMVMPGLWNAAATEDSVLAVHVYRNRVHVGTQAGHCLVFILKRDHLSSGYVLHWSCQLSYPIYAITCLSEEQWLVTTRRTVHLFQSIYTSETSCTTTVSDVSSQAARIRERLTKLSEKLAQRSILESAPPGDATLQHEATESVEQVSGERETEPLIPTDDPAASDEH